MNDLWAAPDPKWSAPSEQQRQDAPPFLFANYDALYVPPPGAVGLDYDKPISSGNMALRMALSALLGLAVGALGVAIHRTLWEIDFVQVTNFPGGLAIGLVLVVSTALLCRALGGMPTFIAGGVALMAAVWILSLPGAGGDVLVADPSSDIPVAWAGAAWSFGSAIAWVLIACLPRRWFARVPPPQATLAPPVDPFRIGAI
ncbi:MAG: hypothetical protein FWD83_05390 [Promicromonosporaceae bacterium]|nr:hypothetical protein [Promicromonosporaceae bacterium]